MNNNKIAENWEELIDMPPVTNQINWKKEAQQYDAEQNAKKEELALRLEKDKRETIERHETQARQIRLFLPSKSIRGANKMSFNMLSLLQNVHFVEYEQWCQKNDYSACRLPISKENLSVLQWKLFMREPMQRSDAIKVSGDKFLKRYLKYFELRKCEKDKKTSERYAEWCRTYHLTCQKLVEKWYTTQQATQHANETYLSEDNSDQWLDSLADKNQ